MDKRKMELIKNIDIRRGKGVFRRGSMRKTNNLDYFSNQRPKY